MAQKQNIITADEAYDAFGRLRVSEPATLFSSQLQYDLEPYQYEAFASDAGIAATYDANKRMAVLTVDAGETGGVSGMQSYQYIPYQSGKSHRIFVTAVLGAPVDGTVKRVGYFDDLNGVFLQQESDGTMSVVLRSSTSGGVVERTIPQSQFNELATGQNGILPNWSRAQIFGFDLQYLGMGRVRCGVDIDGQLIYVTEFLNANNLDVPYMQSGTLPIRIEVERTGAGDPATAYLKCAEVSSEGGTLEDFAYSFSEEGTGTAGNNTPVHILSVRPNTTFTTNDIPNRIGFILDTVDVFVTGNQAVKWQLCIGSTYTEGNLPTWTDVDATHSGFEYGTGGVLADVGKVIAQGYVPATAAQKGSVTRQIVTRYPISLNKAGAARANGTLSLHGVGLGATSTMRAIFNWKEIR
jgi:hypothetical protein